MPAANPSIEIVGVEAGVERLKNLKTLMPNFVVNTILRNVAEAVLARAKYYVPVDTGALKASGRVEKRGSGKDAEYIVAFGDSEKVDYAWVVHEVEEHAHTPPTQAKYLEKAVEEIYNSRDAVFKNIVSPADIVGVLR